MSEELYLSVHAAEFPAQALVRLRPELETEAVAVVDGRPPLEVLCALNRQARLKGAAWGITRLEAEGIDGLRLLTRSIESENAARTVLLECAAQFSPRIEEASRGTACTCVLDIAGTELLFGPAEMLAERLRGVLRASGFRVSIAVSTNFHAARLKAAASSGISVIPDGQEAAALNKLPLAALALPLDPAETFSIWGIRTLGELAALPEVELIARLGQPARQWRDLARGVLPHTFQPIEAEFTLKEFCEFETPVEEVNSLLFVGARMLDCLVTRAALRALSLASLSVEMELEGGRTHRGVIRPALASTDRKFLLKLLQLEFAAHPPKAAVLSFTLTAEAGHSSKMQLGLFAPQTPEPSRLDVTLARLKAMVGEDRVGTPVLEDTHRTGSFRTEGFVVDGKLSESKAEGPRMALRRVRPPRTIQVALRGMKPVAFRDGNNRYEISTAYGPWRTSGCWWSQDGWDTEEWDVLTAGQDAETLGCLLVLDRLHDEWRLEAFYD